MVAEAGTRTVAAVRRACARAGGAAPTLRVLALGLLLLAATGARAAAPALFEVALPVADQGDRARRAAERVALETVLVRVTGRESVLELPALRAALRTADRYYSSSGYERRSVEERLADPESRPWRLRLSFDERSITELLAANDVPVWTTRRPEMLLWLLTEDERGTRRLVGAEDPMGVALAERARRRGLTVILPALDLTDLAAFPMARAWAGFDDALAPVSARYGTEAVLTLRAYPDALGRWLVDWRGEVLDERIDGALETLDAVEGAARAMDAIADALADRFAIRIGAAQQSLWLQVDAVDEVSAYASLLRYLEGTVGVSDVALVQMQGTSLLLRVQAADANTRLLDLLRLEARLALSERPERVGGVAVWRARWRGGRD